MALTSKEFTRLQDAARGFSATKNHLHYLSEVLNCLASTEDPFAPLELLRAMWSSTHAGRQQQEEALHEVGKWLDEQLSEDPHIAVDTLALRVGWLRRLATYHAEKTRQAPRTSISRTAAPRRQEVKPEFGKYIDRLRQRRIKGNAVAPLEVPLPPVPAPPQTLPPVFGVRFKSFLQAREANKTARQRAKSGKAAKETRLELLPTDESLMPLAHHLCCSTIHTVGLDLLFAEVERRSGVAVAFYITEIESEPAGLLARRILLEPLEALQTGEKAAEPR